MGKMLGFSLGKPPGDAVELGLPNSIMATWQILKCDFGQEDFVSDTQNSYTNVI